MFQQRLIKLVQKAQVARPAGHQRGAGTMARSGWQACASRLQEVQEVRAALRLSSAIGEGLFGRATEQGGMHRSQKSATPGG